MLVVIIDSCHFTNNVDQTLPLGHALGQPLYLPCLPDPHSVPKKPTQQTRKHNVPASKCRT